MPAEQGQIVKNLIPTEPVKINQVQRLGGKVSIKYTGINSNIANNKIISSEDFDSLEVLTEEGSFNFTGDPVRFALFAEAERINSAYQFDPLFAVNCSIVDPLPHQVEAVYKYLLPLPKIRFLLADDTGAGKTIMTGLLIKELILRGMLERVLIITPGGLTRQWQEDEMAIKFNLPFQLVNRALFSSDPNIFAKADFVVTSIDFISRDDILNVASNYQWDLIVIDECHKLSAYDYGAKQYLSQRYRAAYQLAQQCEHLLLLTATPHRGREDTFKKLLQLLDEDIFATEDLAATRVKELEKNGINKFFIRRLKEDMKNWDGLPLYKNRTTKTIAYQLTTEEKELYDAVTNYLTKRKEEASESRNIHVSLALSVMQRRLVSSIFAIRNTLQKRWLALNSIVEEVNKNPHLFNQKHKLEGWDVDSLDEFEDLEDDERESLEKIMSDPKKFKLFTTAKSIGEIQQEANEVKRLFEMADSLYKRNQEEQKFRQLQDLLKSNGVIDGEKLVIFTEHKDTLIYLEERLSKSGGYQVATIHGGKNVDERRTAQFAFAKDAQILIATDAAGEGINLQFCKLLINWDIPWNPNRLEQRMGRIHRYGQKQDVLVFNMVASNTKEGHVLEKLLVKLDIIREGIGDDRVYDVIQDVLENVSLEAVMQSVFDGKETDLDKFLAQDDAKIKIDFQERIKAQRESLSHSSVDYTDARLLKEDSDEKRLQPYYISQFFEKAFKQLEGSYQPIRDNIFSIEKLPPSVAAVLKDVYKVYPDNVRGLQFCFDKKVFLDYQNMGKDLGTVHYINPGNPLFDSLVRVVRDTYREDMLKGTILVSPEDKEDYFAFFVKSQIVDERPNKEGESVANEKLIMVCQDKSGDFKVTSPAKFIDFRPPSEFAKPMYPPAVVTHEAVIDWTFTNISEQLLAETEQRVALDSAKRGEYLETAFMQVINDLQIEVNDLQGSILIGNDAKKQDKMVQKQQRINDLIEKKKVRLADMARMSSLSQKLPDVLGCAYIVPLSKLEYQSHFGMSRDDESERIAMQIVMDFESDSGWSPTDVSANNEGYDIRSVNKEHVKRYIEVKGRSGSDGSIMMSENEWYRLKQLGESAWLYIVIDCKSKPQLFRLQNPANTLVFDQKSKGIQYFLPFTNWKGKSL